MANWLYDSPIYYCEHDDCPNFDGPCKEHEELDNEMKWDRLQESAFEDNCCANERAKLTRELKQ